MKTEAAYYATMWTDGELLEELGPFASEAEAEAAAYMPPINGCVAIIDGAGNELSIRY